MSTLHKKVFSRAPVKCFCFWLKWLRFCCFQECWFWRGQRSQFENNTFKKNGYGNFRYVLTLRKKVFSGEPVKCLFLYGSNNWDYVVFMNASFADIKDQFEKYTSFLRQFIYGSFGCISTLHKKVFLGAPVKCFSFLAQISQILLFTRMLLLERSKITVW